MTRGTGRRGAGSHKTKLVVLAADGSVMELRRYEFDPLHMDCNTKVGKGLCSSTSCENRAVFLTKRGRRWWGLCSSCAQVYANGVGYWSPGMKYP